MQLFKIQPETYMAPVFFSDQRRAKIYRETLREEGFKDVVIMRGPDHRRGESFNTVTTMPKNRSKR